MLLNTKVWLNGLEVILVSNLELECYLKAILYNL